MGIFSDVEDYTVDRLQQIALELYDRAYRDYKDHGTPEQAKMMAEWTAVNTFRKKMRINSYKVTVPRSLLPAELLNKKRKPDELVAPVINAPRAPRRGRVMQHNMPQFDWAQAVPEPVANPFLVAAEDDPF